MIKNPTLTNDSFRREVFVYLNRWIDWKDGIIHNEIKQTETDFFDARTDRGVSFWIPVLLLRLSNYLAGSYRKDLLNDSDNKLYEQKSKAFLSDEKVKKHLCFNFSENHKDTTLSQEETVESIISCLKKIDTNTVNIPDDPKLYAFISYEILQIGIENFCES